MTLLWEADFESGNKLDYFDVAEGSIAEPGIDGKYFKAIKNLAADAINEKAITAVNEAWARFWWYHTDRTTTNRIMAFEVEAEPLNDVPLYLGITAAGLMFINKGTFGEETQLDITEAAPLATGTWGYFELHWKIHATAGLFTVKLDDVEILSYSGDTVAVGDPGPVDLVRVGAFFADNHFYDNIEMFDTDPDAGGGSIFRSSIMEPAIFGSIRG